MPLQMIKIPDGQDNGDMKKPDQNTLSNNVILNLVSPSKTSAQKD